MRLAPPPPEGPAPRPDPPSPYCPRCDYDLHVCPGCGAPLQHDIEVCLRCRNAAMFPDPLRRGATP